jgi:hypothetical protein
VIQQNINNNTPGPNSVLFKGYNYVWFFQLTEQCNHQIKEEKENKRILKEQREQSSSSVPFNSDQNGDGDGDGDDDGYGYSNGDVDNSSIPSDFVTSNNFVSSLPSRA